MIRLHSPYNSVLKNFLMRSTQIYHQSKHVMFCPNSLLRVPPITHNVTNIWHHTTPQRSGIRSLFYKKPCLSKPWKKYLMVKYTFNHLFTTFPPQTSFHCLHFILFTFVTYYLSNTQMQTYSCYTCSIINCLWVNIELVGISVGKNKNATFFWK